jgi:putative peptide zinc metalloprotease protein
MSETTLSPLWYRVADLTPRLKPYVRVRRRMYRGQPWHVLSDPIACRYHLVDGAAYEIIGRFDGVRTVQQIWESVCAQNPVSAPTQAETIDMLVRLGRRDLFHSGAVPDLDQQHRDRRQETMRRRMAGLNPLSFRVPLGNPSAWLARLAPRLSFCFGPTAAALWALLVVVGLIAAGSHFGELRASAAEGLLTPSFLALAWFCYPIMKLLHELGHALALHHWRGEVRQVGVAFLVLLPVPYIDASAASGLGSRAQRMAVSAAGIMVETGLAALAVLVWIAVEPGVVRDICLTVATIGGVSTLLVNANPLLRFDGYHILTDAASLPNLAPRSMEHWRYLLRRYLLRVAAAHSPGATRGERVWLCLYAPLSVGYQFWLSATVLLWLAERSPVMAALCAAGLGVALVGRPGFRALRYLASANELGSRRHHAIGIAATAALALLLAFTVVPLPLSTTADGIVWVPEHAAVRAATEGFVDRVHVESGTDVRRGDLLVTLRNEALQAELAQAEAQLADAQATYWRAVQAGVADAQRLAGDVTRYESDTDRLRTRVSQLALNAGTDGIFVMPKALDLPGAFMQKGELLAYVVAPEAADVRVAVPQDRAVLLRERTRAVSLRTVEDPTQEFEGTLCNDLPQAGYDVPSAALTSFGGGQIVADPADRRGLRTREPVALCELSVPQLGTSRLGGHVLVRFDHGFEPLGTQLARRLRQLLLQHVDAARGVDPSTPAARQPL